jgi:ribosomal protein L37AE/L43A
MSDLIERQGAAEIVRRIAGYYSQDYKKIVNLPAIDAAPVVHGRWTPADEYCPVCGESKFKGLDADIWADWFPPYCPNCGAKMDGDKEVPSCISDTTPATESEFAKA